MKKSALFTLLSVAVSLIVLCVIPSVNNSASKPSHDNALLPPVGLFSPVDNGGDALVADGWPVPPLPPPSLSESLVSDGWPVPPLPPPNLGESLVADGWPVPPLPPPNLGESLVADGWPVPPLPPPNRVYAAVKA